MYVDLIYEFREFFKEGVNSSRLSYQLSFGFLPRIFYPGDIIFNENDLVEELYLIRKGKVEVGFTSDNEIIPVVTLTSKNSFGDYYVIRDKRAQFVYQAKDTVEVIGIKKEYFMSILSSFPRKEEVIKRSILERYVKYSKIIVIFFFI